MCGTRRRGQEQQQQQQQRQRQQATWCADAAFSHPASVGYKNLGAVTKKDRRVVKTATQEHRVHACRRGLYWPCPGGKGIAREARQGSIVQYSTALYSSTVAVAIDKKTSSVSGVSGVSCVSWCIAYCTIGKQISSASSMRARVTPFLVGGSRRASSVVERVPEV